jgi:hypothetical protein
MTERELFELSITQLSLPSVVRTGWEMEWKLWLGSEKQPSNQEVIDGLKFSKDEGSILKYKWDPKIGMWVSVLYSAPYGNRDGFYFYVFYLPSGMRLWANTPLEGSRFSEEPPLPK